MKFTSEIRQLLTPFVKIKISYIFFMYRIDLMKRERVTAIIVDFSHKKLRFQKKTIILGTSLENKYEVLIRCVLLYMNTRYMRVCFECCCVCKIVKLYKAFCYFLARATILSVTVCVCLCMCNKFLGVSPTLYIVVGCSYVWTAGEILPILM